MFLSQVHNCIFHIFNTGYNGHFTLGAGHVIHFTSKLIENANKRSKVKVSSSLRGSIL
jgi:hypothetical protein